jgi:2-methylcitrate dehydratase PrpD
MIPVGYDLARFAHASRLDALPEAVRHQGVRAFVNFIGCAAGGAREDSVEIALGLARDLGRGGTAVVIGRDERLDMLGAASVNALSSSVHSFNDTHFETVAHPTSTVAAALLGVAAQQKVTGEALIHALILGIEVQCRIGRILTAKPAQTPIGLSMVGMVGGIGAAVAVARLRGLDQDAMLMAIAIAANQAAGLREAHATMSSHHTPALQARGGIESALLAERGFTAAPTMIEGPKGFAASFGTNANLAAAVEGLGETYEISRLAYKPYPCGFVIHPVIDACLALRRDPAFDLPRVREIKLRLSPVAVALTNRPEPRDHRHALVSFQHWAAASLLRGQAGLEEGRPAAVVDPDIARLRAAVTHEVDPDMGSESAFAALRLDGGQSIEVLVDDCLGSAGNPMTDAQLNGKFEAQGRLRWSVEQVEANARWAWDILGETDVGGHAPALSA